MKRHFRPLMLDLERRDLKSDGILVFSHAHTVQVAAAGGSSGGIGTITDNPNPPANPREVARREFRAVFTTGVVAGPPRTTDEAKQFRLAGGGGSTDFLHGTLSMVLLTPANPATTQVVGAASLQDRNTNDAGVILMNLAGDPSAVDRHGRPTQLAFDVNGSGGSGGAFASSTGGGTVAIHYQGQRAVVVFKGTINTTGVGNPLSILSPGQ